MQVEDDITVKVWEANMLKQKSIVTFLLLAILMPFNGFAFSPASSLFTEQESMVNKHFVNISIDKIQFLGKTGDIIGDGEFRLLILSADTKGKSSGLYCPGNAPIKVKQGDTVGSIEAVKTVSLRLQVKAFPTLFQFKY